MLSSLQKVLLNGVTCLFIFCIYNCMKSFQKPATGGPIVKGMLNIPRRNPIACEASPGPTMSNAIGPSRHTNTPSQIPITKLMPIRAPKLLANGIHKVEIPRTRRASCCIFIRLIHCMSASFPQTIRLTPDVILRHNINQLPSSPGKLSSVYLG